MNPLEKRRKAEERLVALRKERAGLEAGILANMRQTRRAVRQARAAKLPVSQIEELIGLSRATLYRRLEGPSKTTLHLQI